MFRLLTPITAHDPYRWLRHCDYQLCTSVADLRAYLAPAMASGAIVGCDWETNGLNVWSPLFRIVGFVCSTHEGSARYVPVGHLTNWQANLPLVEVGAVLRELDARCPTAWYSFKFDGEVIARRLGFELVRWVEAMFFAWLYDCDHKKFGLKEVVTRILKLTQMSYADVTHGESVTFAELDPADQRTLDYACADGDCTRRIAVHPKVVAMVRKQQEVFNLEQAFLPVLRATINNGVYIDVHRLRELDEVIGAPVMVGKKVIRPTRPGGQVAELDRSIRDLLHIPDAVNLNSPAQMAPFVEAAGIPLIEKTPTGKAALNKKVLGKLREQYPVIEAYVRRRELITQSNNYIRKLIAAHEHFGAHVRFPFQQLGAPTGRMSSGGEGKKAVDAFVRGYVNLNIQSLPDPKKQPYLPDIRSAIVAADPDAPDADEWEIVSIDYSQIELRLAANLSREPQWIDAFTNGVDIHARNAQIGFRDPTIDEDNPLRAKGKTAGFAVLYGAQAKTVAKNADMTEEQATEMLDNFWAGAPVVAQWVRQSHTLARAHLLVTTWLGRIRPLQFFYVHPPDTPRKIRMSRESRGDREAVNDKVQGGAADIFKLACVRVYRLIVERGWQADVKMCLFVHDELVFAVRKAVRDEAVSAIRQVMEGIQIRDWPVPFLTDAKHGPSWSEKKGPRGLVSFPKVTRTTAAPAGAVTPRRPPAPVPAPPPTMAGGFRR